MATATNQYQPDYAVPPGWIIEERLAAQGISPAELARRCGRSAKLISEIISGKAPIAPKTALQFEKVMGLDASIWLGIEADYRLHRERQAEARTTEESVGRRSLLCLATRGSDSSSPATIVNRTYVDSRRHRE